MGFNTPIAGQQQRARQMSAHKETVKATVEAMINEIGKLRQFVAIDSMPTKLQQVRQLLRELDAEMEQKK